MPFIRASLVFLLSAALLATPALAARTHRAKTASHHTSTTSHTKKTTKSRRHSRHRHVRRVRGQKAIEPARVKEIQEALIREHYLDGEADGNWDTRTKSAMQKFQSDQGWQTKLTPDSRALKKLGLGPDYSNAINAKGSTFSAPPPLSTIPTDQAEGFASASGVSE